MCVHATCDQCFCSAFELSVLSTLKQLVTTRRSRKCKQKVLHQQPKTQLYVFIFTNKRVFMYLV